jgi:hypothetical protein
VYVKTTYSWKVQELYSGKMIALFGFCLVILARFKNSECDVKSLSWRKKSCRWISLPTVTTMHSPVMLNDVRLASNDERGTTHSNFCSVVIRTSDSLRCWGNVIRALCVCGCSVFLAKAWAGGEDDMILAIFSYFTDTVSSGFLLIITQWSALLFIDYLASS